jgi:RES domain-containing protein
VLYRVFPYRQGAGVTEPGGALFVGRDRQGMGRHDNPDRYGALYVSRAAESAIAERIQAFRGQELAEADLRRVDGTVLALATIDDGGLRGLVDLDEPRELVRRRLRPSGVATGNRTATQRLALDLHAEGIPGFAWWSTLEASWANVTLFAEAAAGSLRLAADPLALALDVPELRLAAETLGVGLSR